MTRTEAIKELLNGKKVFHVDWYDGAYIYLYVYTVRDEHNQYVGWKIFDDYNSDFGWRIYE
jgi:hypothetical protein